MMEGLKLQKIKDTFKKLADNAESYYPNNPYSLNDSCTISSGKDGIFKIHISAYLDKEIQKTMFNLFDRAVEEVENER